MTLFSNAVDFSRFVPGYTENLGFSLSAGTFSVQGAQSALSQDNAAYVVIPSTTGGLQRVYRVVANQTFTDGASGSVDDQRFGLISGDVWGANDIPFFVYAVENDAQTAVAFMISRNPAALLAPAAASIGKSGAIVNVGQGDFFSLANITVGDYDGNPCTYIGCFRMRFVGATNSWTVQTLNSTTDGVGLNFDNKLFNFPTGVQGAASGSFFIANGGTAPIWSVQQETYNIKRNGNLTINFGANSNTTPGAGAVTAALSLPYTFSVVTFPYIGYMLFISTGTNTYFMLGINSNSSPAPLALFFQSAIVGQTQNTTFAANTTVAANFTLAPYAV